MANEAKELNEQIAQRVKSFKIKLTKQIVEAVNGPQAGQVFVADSECRGLHLRVIQGGTRSFVFVGRVHGEKYSVTLGKWPALSLQEARQRVNDYRREIARGVDPFAQEQSAREAAEAEMTFAGLRDEYFARHGEIHKAVSSVAADRRNLANHIPDNWYGRRLSSFAPKDFLDLHFAITKSGETKPVGGRARQVGGPIIANRVMALLRNMFAKAIKWSHLTGANPVAAVGPEDKNPERTRERSYTMEEIARLSASLEQEAKPWQDYFGLTLHYGTRKNELLSARWQNVDFKAGRLVIPKTKAGKALVLPLDEQARPIIEALDSRGRSEWLFPALGWSKHEYMRDAQGVWQRIRERASVTDRDAVIHTLRHTALTGLAAAGYNASTIQSIANHASLSMSQKYINRLALNVNEALEDPSRPSFVKRALPTPVMPAAVNVEQPTQSELPATDADDPLC